MTVERLLEAIEKDSSETKAAKAVLWGLAARVFKDVENPIYYKFLNKINLCDTKSRIIELFDKYLGVDPYEEGIPFVTPYRSWQYLSSESRAILPNYFPDSMFVFDGTLDWSNGDTEGGVTKLNVLEQRGMVQDARNVVYFRSFQPVLIGNSVTRVGLVVFWVEPVVDDASLLKFLEACRAKPSVGEGYALTLKCLSYDPFTETVVCSPVEHELEGPLEVVLPEQYSRASTAYARGRVPL